MKANYDFKTKALAIGLSAVIAGSSGVAALAAAAAIGVGVRKVQKKPEEE